MNFIRSIDGGQNCFDYFIYRFQNGLYISQGLQVCFFFAFIMSVSSSVRYAVWERESGNVEV